MDTKTRRGPSRKGKGKSGYRIMAFPFGEQVIEAAVEGGEVRWTAEVGGKRYGAGLKLRSSSAEDVAAAAFQLAINAVETLTEIDAD